MRFVRCRSAVSSGVRKKVSSASEGRSDHPLGVGEGGASAWMLILILSSSLLLEVEVSVWSTGPVFAKKGGNASESKRRRASYLYSYRLCRVSDKEVFFSLMHSKKRGEAVGGEGEKEI